MGTEDGYVVLALRMIFREYQGDRVDRIPTTRAIPHEIVRDGKEILQPESLWHDSNLSCSECTANRENWSISDLFRRELREQTAFLLAPKTGDMELVDTETESICSLEGAFEFG